MSYEDAVARVESGETEKPGPGKWEGNEDRVLAEILHDLSIDGACDASFGSMDEGGWFGRIGRFTLHEDSQGFFTYKVYVDEDNAADDFASDEDNYTAMDEAASQ